MASGTCYVVHPNITKQYRIIDFMKQLLPCPFCGKEPEVDNYKIKDIKHWNVSCMNDACLVHAETDDFELKKEAIKAWNKRSS